MREIRSSRSLRRDGDRPVGDLHRAADVLEFYLDVGAIVNDDRSQGLEIDGVVQRRNVDRSLLRAR